MTNQLLKTFLLAGITVFFIACTSGGGDKTADTEAETDVAESTEDAPEESAGILPFTKILSAWHHVEDYDSWKAVYDKVEHSSETDGLGKLLVGVEQGDPNHVFVTEIVYSIDAAKSFFESERFENAVAESGVTGETDISFIDIIYIGAPAGDSRQRVSHEFKVIDFAAFVDVFQSESQVTGGADRDDGVILQFIGRDTEDPNSVMLTYILNDRAKLDAMLGSEDWNAALEKATVTEGITNYPLLHLDRRQFP